MHIDLNALPEKERYKLLMSSIVPRPIALVTSIDEQARVNAAPFSFFNLMGTTPATVVIGIDSRGRGVPKDTVRNVHLTGEFVVNLVSEAMVERMNLCSAPLPAGEDELAFSGLTAAPSVQVTPPRVTESPISLECRRTVSLDVGNGRTLIVGHVLHYHIRDEFYDAGRGYVLADRLRLVARMHGKSWYARTSDLFELERPAGSSTAG
jgi:flavin reductase (DIM6/NTAB) family NADH-FMN oxidoreductase RutF